MTNRSTRVATNGTGLPIHPRTGKPFASIAQLAAFEHSERHRAAAALAEHNLTKLKTQRR